LLHMLLCHRPTNNRVSQSWTVSQKPTCFLFYIDYLRHFHNSRKLTGTEWHTILQMVRLRFNEMKSKATQLVSSRLGTWLHVSQIPKPPLCHRSQGLGGFWVEGTHIAMTSQCGPLSSHLERARFMSMPEPFWKELLNNSHKKGPVNLAGFLVFPLLWLGL
jgi:hypothetical protein